MPIAEDVIERVVSDLDALIEHFPGAKRRGAKWVASCPFHAEKTPSCYLSLFRGKALFRCYGCGANGTVIDVVRLTQGVSFRSAVAILGGEVDERPWNEAEQDRQRASAMERMPLPTSAYDIQNGLVYCDCGRIEIKIRGAGRFEMARVSCGEHAPAYLQRFRRDVRKAEIQRDRETRTALKTALEEIRKEIS